MPRPGNPEGMRRRWLRPRKIEATHEQLPLLFRSEQKAHSKDIRAARERVEALERTYENEKRYDPQDASKTRKELEQAGRELKDMVRKRKEMAEIVFAKRRIILAERATRPGPELTNVSFMEQRARDALFDALTSDGHFNNTLREASKRLGIRLKKSVKPPSYTALFLNKDIQRRPESMRTQLSEHKYAQAVADAAKEYAGQAAFYEGLLAEMKRAMPDDAATRAYEQQLMRLRQRVAR